MLAIIGTVAVVIASGAICLGSVSNQVQVNTHWINRAESFLNEVRQHNSDTLAREHSFEQRIDKIEQRLENERRDRKSGLPQGVDHP